MPLFSGEIMSLLKVIGSRDIMSLKNYLWRTFVVLSDIISTETVVQQRQEDILSLSLPQRQISAGPFFYVRLATNISAETFSWSSYM